MTAFVLIHGSGQNSGCWARVGELLSASGHAVAIPELPKRAPDLGLAAYAAGIAKTVVQPRTIIVAHSFSGIFLPLVAHAVDCAQLVFLAAVIPEPGKSVRQQFGEDAGMFHRDWIDAGPRWFETSQVEGVAREFLFHDCDEATMPWALDTVELFDTRHLVTEPAPFTEWPGVPSASIVCTQDRTLTPQWIRKMSVRRGMPIVELQAGHCPHVSRPADVARILEQLAAEQAA